jgi:hypothetical protein
MLGMTKFRLVDHLIVCYMGLREKPQVPSFWLPHKGRVPHISLVFREMWDTTALSL